MIKKKTERKRTGNRGLWPIARDLLPGRSGQGQSVSHDPYCQPAAGSALSAAVQGESHTAPQPPGRKRERMQPALTGTRSSPLVIIPSSPGHGDSSGVGSPHRSLQSTFHPNQDKFPSGSSPPFSLWLCSPSSEGPGAAGGSCPVTRAFAKSPVPWLWPWPRENKFKGNREFSYSVTYLGLLSRSSPPTLSYLKFFLPKPSGRGGVGLLLSLHISQVPGQLFDPLLAGLFVLNHL